MRQRIGWKAGDRALTRNGELRSVVAEPDDHSGSLHWHHVSYGVDRDDWSVFSGWDELITHAWTAEPVSDPRYVVSVAQCSSTKSHGEHFYVLEVFTRDEASPGMAFCRGFIGKAFTMCQVADPALRDALPCKHTESHGYQCERIDPHGEDGHRIGRHTIKHSLAGNGYHCDSFD